MSRRNDGRAPRGQVAMAFTSAGELVCAARTRMGLTQGELAEEIGVTRAQVNAVEHGRSSIPGFRVSEFCDVLNIDARELCDALRSDWWACA